jgi:hypothetical protein
MKIFTIENETNNITIHATVQEAEAVPNAERFRNEAGLAKMAANWPASRLVEIWNGLPGETPVKKFKDRATAVSRIWKAIQSLGQAVPAVEEPVPVSEPTANSKEVAVSTDVAPHAPDVASSEPAATKKATRAKKAPAAATNPGAPREGSKASQVIAMLKREGGTTLEEIMTAMGWLKHTTRAMLSAGGSITKNHGLVVTSEKVGDKRTYSIKA